MLLALLANCSAADTVLFRSSRSRSKEFADWEPIKAGKGHACDPTTDDKGCADGLRC